MLNEDRLTKQEQDYLGGLRIAISALPEFNDVEVYVTINKMMTQSVVLRIDGEQKTFGPDTAPSIVLAYGLGFIAGRRKGVRETTNKKEQQLRELLGIVEGEDGFLKVDLK